MLVAKTIWDDLDEEYYVIYMEENGYVNGGYVATGYVI